MDILKNIGFSFAGTIFPTIIFIIFYSIANKSIKKYIKEANIPDGKAVMAAFRWTFLTYYVTMMWVSYMFGGGELLGVYAMILCYGVLGTISYAIAHGHRRMYGKNDVTTILCGFTYRCWQVMQMIILVVLTVVDIIVSLFVDDWKQTKKSIKAKENVEKYFREASVDKPVNYQDGLNIEYRKFIETTSSEDNGAARKKFADEYFKTVYSK